MSVAEMLQRHGHEVIIQRDVIPQNSSDPIVALVSVQNDAILLSFDNDFKAIASRFGVSNRRFKKLSRIQFKCEYPVATERMEAGLSLIEFEWNRVQQSEDKRLFMEIQGYAFRTNR